MAINRLKNQKRYSRFVDTQWFFGIVLNYLSEFGNWYAITLSPASLITPLGIVSVLVNVTLANLVLKETITANQSKGYFLMLIGVFIILYSAPRKQKNVGVTLVDIFEFCSSTRFVYGFCVLIVSLIALISSTSRQWLLYRYACICSLFGAFSITCTKFIAALINVSYSDSISQVPSQANVFILYTAITSISATVIQESFKQKALAKFKVSKFTPVLYSAFNAT
jgi:hypothetical protein